MHPLYCPVLQLLRRDSDGRLLLFADGGMSRARVIPDDTTAERLILRLTVLWYGAMILVPLLLSVGRAWSLLAAGGVALLHWLGVRSLTAGLPVVAAADTWGERQDRLARCKGRRWLVTELTAELLLAVAAMVVFYVWFDLLPLAPVLAVVALVGAGFSWSQLRRLDRPAGATA